MGSHVSELYRQLQRTSNFRCQRSYHVLTIELTEGSSPSAKVSVRDLPQAINAAISRTSIRPETTTHASFDDDTRTVDEDDDGDGGDGDEECAEDDGDDDDPVIHRLEDAEARRRSAVTT